MTPTTRDKDAHVFNKLVLPSDILQARKADLRDDGAELATRGRNAVCRRAVPRGEHLSGNDKRGRVGTEVLEEVGEAVEEDERLRGRRSRDEFVVTKACAPTPLHQFIVTHMFKKMNVPMMTKRMVSMMKPMSWIGLRPHESMNRKDTQYPGIRPAADKIKLPTQILCRFSYTPRVPLVGGVPKPMAVRMMDELRPRP